MLFDLSDYRKTECFLLLANGIPMKQRKHRKKSLQTAKPLADRVF